MVLSGVHCIYRLDDDVADLGQVRINKTSEKFSQQCTMSAVAGEFHVSVKPSLYNLPMSIEVQTCDTDTADGDDSSTAMMAQMKEDQTVVSPNEDSLAPLAAKPSPEIVERPDTIVKGSESGKDVPRERTGRMRRIWRNICGGTRRVRRVLLPCLCTPCLCTPTETDDSNARRQLMIHLEKDHDCYDDD